MAWEKCFIASCKHEKITQTYINLTVFLCLMSDMLKITLTINLGVVWRQVRTSLFSRRVPRLLWALTWFGANLKTRKQRRHGYCYLKRFSKCLSPSKPAYMYATQNGVRLISVYRASYSHCASYTIPLLTPLTILNLTLLTLLTTIRLQGYIKSHNPLD